jgi:hypothetical protein
MWDSRTKYMVMSGDRNAGQNYNLKTGNKSDKTGGVRIT